MIDVNNAINLNINKRTSKLITLGLSSTVLVIFLILVWVVSTEKEIGEDWLLALVAIFPATLVVLASWMYIILAKKSLNSDELLQQTFEILSQEIPLTLSRRLLYYTKMYNDAGQLDQFKDIGVNTKSLLNLDYLKEQTKDYISIKSNVILGITSCQYKIEGNIIEKYPLIKNLTIGLQLNINQIEATYTFDGLDAKKINSLIEKVDHTFKGAESAGYKTRVTEFKSSVKFKARMNFSEKKEDANLLLDSCDKLFFVQDFSLMTGSLISLLKGVKL